MSDPKSARTMESSENVILIGAQFEKARKGQTARKLQKKMPKSENCRNQTSCHITTR
jgi:hypothetical protein